MGKGTGSARSVSSIVIYRDRQLDGSGEMNAAVMYWIYVEDIRTQKQYMFTCPQPKVGTSLLLALPW